MLWVVHWWRWSGRYKHRSKKKQETTSKHFEDKGGAPRKPFETGQETGTFPRRQRPPSVSQPLEISSWCKNAHQVEKSHHLGPGNLPKFHRILPLPRKPPSNISKDFKKGRILRDFQLLYSQLPLLSATLLSATVTCIDAYSQLLSTLSYSTVSYFTVWASKSSYIGSFPTILP